MVIGRVGDGASARWGVTAMERDGDGARGALVSMGVTAIGCEERLSRWARRRLAARSACLDGRDGDGPRGALVSMGATAIGREERLSRWARATAILREERLSRWARVTAILSEERLS